MKPRKTTRPTPKVHVGEDGNRYRTALWKSGIVSGHVIETEVAGKWFPAYGRVFNTLAEAQSFLETL